MAQILSSPGPGFDHFFLLFLMSGKELEAGRNTTMVSVSTVQPSLNQEFLCTLV